MFVSLTLTLKLKSYGRVWRFTGHYITQLLLLYTSRPERVLQERDLQVPFILKKAPGVGQKYRNSSLTYSAETHQLCLESRARNSWELHWNACSNLVPHNLHRKMQEFSKNFTSDRMCSAISSPWEASPPKCVNAAARARLLLHATDNPKYSCNVCELHPTTLSAWIIVEEPHKFTWPSIGKKVRKTLFWETWHLMKCKPHKSRGKGGK